jgi:hypothetical protein
MLRTHFYQYLEYEDELLIFNSLTTISISRFPGHLFNIRPVHADRFYQCCGSGAFLTPGSGMGKKIRIRIRDEQPGSYFRELRNNFFS